MCFIRHTSLLAAILTLYSIGSLAQQSTATFRPGKWEIDSVTTATDGRTVSSTTNICAEEQMDFWKVAQPGLDCKPPKSHPAAHDGLRVEVVCIYDQDALHSEIRSNVVEKFSDHGNSFTVVGTQTTNTVFQGVRPTLNSVHLQSTAHRTGDCQK